MGEQRCVSYQGLLWELLDFVCFKTIRKDKIEANVLISKQKKNTDLFKVFLLIDIQVFEVNLLKCYAS